MILGDSHPSDYSRSSKRCAMYVNLAFLKCMYSCVEPLGTNSITISIQQWTRTTTTLNRNHAPKSGWQPNLVFLSMYPSRSQKDVNMAQEPLTMDHTWMRVWEQNRTQLRSFCDATQLYNCKLHFPSHRLEPQSLYNERTNNDRSV